MTGGDDLCLAQEDGSRPTALAAGSAPGESGVSILSVDFRGGAHFSATPQRHMIWFQTSPRAHFACRIAGRSVSHDVPARASPPFWWQSIRAGLHSRRWRIRRPNRS